MALKITWSRPALQDMQDIRKFLKQYTENASGVVKDILRNVDKLHPFLYLGRPGRISGTRELVVLDHPYIVIYGVKEDTQEKPREIAIYHVYHARSNWQANLDEENPVRSPSNPE